MRLTTKTSIMGRKHDIAYGCASIWKKKLKNDKYELIENAVDKLGQLEDIEQEIGVDLITLFKLFKSCWHKIPKCYDKKEMIKQAHNIRIGLDANNKVYIIANDIGYSIEDFGTKIALTKEELEK